MYNETQLSAIRLFGRKDLTEGCIIRDTDDSSYVRYAFNNEYSDPIIVQLEGVFIGQFDDISIEELQDEEEWEILGHEPHLFPDVARVAEARGWNVIIDTQFTEITFYVVDSYGENENIAFFPYSPTLPLLDQPNLSEIVNLFSK